jgi:hypothetical protein
MKPLLLCILLLLPVLASANDSFTSDVNLKLQNRVTGFDPHHAVVDPWLAEMSLREIQTRSAIAEFADRAIGHPSDLDAGVAEWTLMIDAMKRLRKNLLELHPNEAENVISVVDERIADALLTAETMDAVVGAVVSTVRDENRQTILRNMGILSGRTRTVPIVGAPVAHAGDWFDEIELALDSSIAWVRDDQARGSGRDIEIDLSLIGRIGQQLELGLSASRSRYAIGGPTSLEYHSQGLDLFGQFHASEHLSFGLFVNTTYIDIEDRAVVLPALATPIQLGDSYTRWGLGASATLAGELAGLQLGWTSSIASTENTSLADAFDQKNSVWVNLFDLTHFWSDSLSTTLHATSFHAIKNTSTADGRFWFVGASANWAINDRVSLEAGYEKTLALRDFREDRVILSLVYGF